MSTINDPIGSVQEAIDCIEWYRRCLEDFQDGRAVADLAEAKAGYNAAIEFLMHCVVS